MELCLQQIKCLRQEYAAVCSLIQRSGLHNIQKLPQHAFSRRNFHSTVRRCQQQPQDGRDPKKPKKGEDDEDKDKISSLLAKAFLWMLTAYMVIAIISLLFPSSNQPEVSHNSI